MKIETITKSQRKFLEILSQFTVRDQIILMSRFLNRKTQKEMGTLFNLTTERIRQLEDRALRLIHKQFK